MIEQNEIQLSDEKTPKFVIVEVSQLEKLLQRCPECGNLPEGKSKDKPRNILWTQSGTNLRATIRCKCIGIKNNSSTTKVNWSCQEVIPGIFPILDLRDLGTLTRTGNLSIVAAARVAPIEFADLSSFFEAAKMPFMCKSNFLRLSKTYVWPSIEDAFYRQQADLYASLTGNVDIALDGQFDSPGYSAELCAVSAIEETTKKVLDFSIVHKSEVDNVSTRMELEGVKKCLASIEAHNKVNEVTVDKHPSVCAYLKKEDYEFRFDPWHRLKSVKKELRKMVKELSTEEDRDSMKDLARRFIVHLHSSIERAEGNVSVCKELVFSFFLHVQGLHRWTSRSFKELITVSPDRKACPRFNNERFIDILECPHLTEATHPDSSHEAISPQSLPYQKVLSIATKAQFMTDIDRLKNGKLTSYNESFNSIRISYCPKRKYFPQNGFEKRTMLAALEWNALQDAELAGERPIIEIASCFSKAKQEKVPKYKKRPIKQEWKMAIVDETLARKQKHGPGDPNEIEEDDQEEGSEIYTDRTEEILYFSDVEDCFDM